MLQDFDDASIEDSDATLVAAAILHDHDAFGKLYERHADSVFRLLNAQLRVRAVAEDLASETFLRAWNNIARFQPQYGEFGGWIHVIARNLVRDHFKSSRYRWELLDGENYDAADLGRGPEALALRELEVAKLRRGIKQLTEDQRQCVMLRFVVGLTIAETAALMERNENSIKQLQHRGIRSLAKLIG